MDDPTITSWAHVVPWWYRAVPGELSKQQRLFLSTTVDYFSFGILLKTLFQPWKRDEQSVEGLSLQQRFEVWGANLVSRGVGAVVRGGAIVFGGIAIVLLLTLFALLWVGWAVAPFLALFLVGFGLYGMIRGGY